MATRARLPRTARLRSPAAFRRVFARGRRQVDTCFVVIHAANGEGGPRLGLAISRRRARRAVDRNRIKRLVRESFRQQAGALPSADVVVLARSATVQRGNHSLHASLARHWRRMIDTQTGTAGTD